MRRSSALVQSLLSLTRGPLQTSLDSIPSTSALPSDFAWTRHYSAQDGGAKKEGGKNEKDAGTSKKDKGAGSAAKKVDISSMEMTAPVDQVQFYRSIIEEHLYNVVYPDLILKHNIKNVSELPQLKEVILHQSTPQLLGSPQAFLPAMAAVQLVSGRRPDVVQDVRKSGVGVDKRSVHVPTALVAKLRHRDMYRFLDRTCIQALLNQVREWPGARWDWNGHVRFKFPNLFAYDEVAGHVEEFKSVDTVDVELHIDTKGKGHVLGMLIATGIGIPVDREYPGPREMTDRPLMRRAPRAGEPGPRRRKLIEERKRALSDSYKRAREAKE